MLNVNRKEAHFEHVIQLFYDFVELNDFLSLKSIEASEKWEQKDWCSRKYWWNWNWWVSYFLVCKQAPENLVKRFRFSFGECVSVCVFTCACASITFSFQSVCSWLAFLSLQIKITHNYIASSYQHGKEMNVFGYTLYNGEWKYILYYIAVRWCLFCISLGSLPFSSHTISS